jgi:hypothetical protein
MSHLRWTKSFSGNQQARCQMRHTSFSSPTAVLRASLIRLAESAFSKFEKKEPFVRVEFHGGGEQPMAEREGFEPSIPL